MLTSVQNTKVKEWKKLHKRKYRKQTGQFLVEGHHLVEEVLASDWTVLELIRREGTDFTAPPEIKVTEVDAQVFAAVAETETPQGIAAVVEQKTYEFLPAKRTLMIDAVQDPGNIGTLIRTADAAGFDQVLLGTGSVDPFNDKVIRATQGSIFHLPILTGELTEFMNELKAEGVEIWAAALQEAKPYKDMKTPDRVALLVGNEGQGIAEHLLEQSEKKVYIPIYGRAESLNVAVAGAVLMYHLQS
ncbi:RNA methyltransferase [Halobacillus sp. ACCC02827]|uniref:TrmH family RNA methyltransferase n=1 Tax=Halobacillus sp. ACCC02827 TaxID=3052090 RepID=UPI002570492E|nr:RNA methyltransferase [Halobacillus sp. ACCC02827]WJE14591.1 RNA methyltransferase [Halobacillus sp. ACCC02827]